MSELNYNVFNKLNNFIKIAKEKQRKLEEATFMVQRLKEDIDLSHKIEENLRLKLTREQERALILQNNLNNFVNTKAEVDNQNSMLLKQENALKDIDQVINGLKQSIQDRVAIASKESVLINEIKNLKNQLDNQKDNFFLQKIEFQTELKNKELLINQLQANINGLNSELEAVKYECNTLKRDLDYVHIEYDKRICDYEKIMRESEKNDVNTKGESVPPPQCDNDHCKTSGSRVDVTKYWDKKLNLTWADAARKAKLNDSNIAQPDFRHEVKSTSGTFPGIFQQSASEDGKSKFKFQFKMPTAPPRVPTLKVPPFASKVTPLDVKTVKDYINAPKRKKLFNSEDGDLL